MSTHSCMLSQHPELSLSNSALKPQTLSTVSLHNFPSLFPPIVGVFSTSHPHFFSLTFPHAATSNTAAEALSPENNTKLKTQHQNRKYKLLQHPMINFPFAINKEAHPPKILKIGPPRDINFCCRLICEIT